MDEAAHRYGRHCAFFNHHIVEIDRMLAERSYIDDTRGRAGLQQRPQQAREQKTGKIWPSGFGKLPRA
jgi:hypothetical protein